MFIEEDGRIESNLGERVENIGLINGGYVVYYMEETQFTMRHFSDPRIAMQFCIERGLKSVILAEVVPLKLIDARLSHDNQSRPDFAIIDKKTKKIVGFTHDANKIKPHQMAMKLDWKDGK